MAGIGENRRKWLYLALAALLAGYWLAIFVATHWPAARMPDVVSHNDKLHHFLAYAGLAFLLATALLLWRSHWRLFQIAALVFGIAAVYGIIDETTQNFVAGRSAEVADWLADMAGAAMGIVAAAVMSKMWLRSK